MVFRESQGTQIYLGEWHTHREVEPSPSWKDRHEIRRAFRKSTLNLEFLILVIVGILLLKNWKVFVIGILFLAYGYIVWYLKINLFILF